MRVEGRARERCGGWRKKKTSQEGALGYHPILVYLFFTRFRKMSDSGDLDAWLEHEDRELRASLAVATLASELATVRPNLFRVRALGRQLWPTDAGVPDEVRADLWAVLLGVDRRDTVGATEGVRGCACDMSNQRVVRADAERTRADLAMFKVGACVVCAWCVRAWGGRKGGSVGGAREGTRGWIGGVGEKGERIGGSGGEGGRGV